MVKVRDVPNTKNITKQDDGYYIRKYINGKHTYLGYGSTLIIALMRLDWCRANDWKPYRPNKTYILKHENGYAIRKWNGEKTEHLGFFKTLKEAEKEVELFKKYGWDLEAVCNNSEEIEEYGEQFLTGIKHGSTFQTKTRNDYHWAKRSGMI